MIPLLLLYKKDHPHEGEKKLKKIEDLEKEVEDLKRQIERITDQSHPNIGKC